VTESCPRRLGAVAHRRRGARRWPTRARLWPTLVALSALLALAGCRDEPGVPSESDRPESGQPSPAPAAAAPLDSTRAGAPEAREATPGGDVVTCFGNQYQRGSVGKGAQMIWDQELWCLEAGPTGRYSMPVRVANPGGDAVRIDRVELHKITPGGLREAWNELIGPPAESVVFEGLPIALAPGGEATFTIRGRYLMNDDVDGSRRVNLHFVAHAVSHVDPGDGVGQELAIDFTGHVSNASEPEDAPGRGRGGGRPDRR